jgi:hypothetical protein
MLDTINAFMFSFVTHYFASCGESLETILNDNTGIRSSSIVTSSENQNPGRNRHNTDQLTANGTKRQPLETQEIHGTDLVFFPIPSSELSSSSLAVSTAKKYRILEERTNRKVNDGMHPPRRHRKILRNSEVASRWIAMGSKENTIYKTSSTPSPPPSLENNYYIHGQSHKKTVFPYDEIESRKTNQINPIIQIQQNNNNNNTSIPSSSSSTTTSTTSTSTLRMATTENAQQSHHWMTAEDPNTGKLYYYHEITRETQWRPPLCLASDDERLAMEEKEQKEKDFFAAMEANILSSLSRGVIPGTSKDGGAGTNEQQKSLGIRSRKSLRKSSRIGSTDERPELMRTISAMDETILIDIIRRQPSFRSVKLSRQSLHLEDLAPTTGRRSSTGVRDGFDSWNSSSQESYYSEHLETLEEDSGDAYNASNSMSNLLSNIPDEDSSSNSLYDDESFSLRGDGGKFEQSSSTGFGLSWKETQALNRLVSLTKEMIDTDKEELDIDDDSSIVVDNEIFAATAGLGTKTERPRRRKEDEDSSSLFDDKKQVQNVCTSHTRNLQRATEGEIRRVLPREMDFEGSDGEDAKPKSIPTPRKEKAARMVANSGKTAADLLDQRKKKLKRRNTCGTMFIRTTMSAPDKDATIRCVCGVYRSHILSSEHETTKGKDSNPFDVFNDYDVDREGCVVTRNIIPSLDEVATFFRDIFFKAQMEADCIILSLIYVERLIKVTHGRLRPKKSNWRSLLFSTMILSSKVWDDLSMWNGDFSQSCPSGVNFSLQRTNQLELAVLNTLHFKVKVPASEYAKYYFLLRSMLIKSGLAGENLGSLDPLDVEGARRLQQVSSQFESTSLMKFDASVAIQRSKSLATRPDYNITKVGLEQVVKM